MQADAAPSILAELIEGVPELALRHRPLPDKWSVGEIIAHLAEDEVASSWRYLGTRDDHGRTACTDVLNREVRQRSRVGITVPAELPEGLWNMDGQ